MNLDTRVGGTDDEDAEDLKYGSGCEVGSKRQQEEKCVETVTVKPEEED